MEALFRDAASSLRQSCDGSLQRMRAAQHRWSERPVESRLSVLRKFRTAVAADPTALARVIKTCRRHSSIAEILTSEVLPLLDACKFAEKNTARLLRPRRPRRHGRPLWLAGVDLRVSREPYGLVLIIAPSNYPLFLAGVQALQALATGNAVLIKPGPRGEDTVRALGRLLTESGVDPLLFNILGSNPANAEWAIREGVDKVVITGSAQTGCAVLLRAAETLTPVTCELSGCDAVIVLPGADPQLVARALHFGLRLNASQTCMRPHRVLVHASLHDEVLRLTLNAVRELRVPLSAAIASQLQSLIGGATISAARQLSGTLASDGAATPFIFDEVEPTSSLWRADIFAPVLALRSFGSELEMLELYEACPYALGAAVFGPTREAQRVASRLNAGFVTVNDVIVPTADPRVPFAGRKHSGFGVTRGEEGLLEFTRVKAVSTRRRGHLHFNNEMPDDANLFAGVIAALHGGGVLSKTKGILKAVRSATQRKREREE
jgi:acyl-CoA reductase-like NAD-dependent aldehyde dehydrogenase